MTYFFQRGILLMTFAAIMSLVIPVLVYHKTGFKPELTATEQTVVNFSPTSLQLQHKSWQETRLIPPVKAELPAAPQTSGAGKPAVLLPPKPTTAPLVVSFILHDGIKSMAIISGTLVKIGDQVNGWRVERIERNRVLLMNRKGTRWLTLD